MLNLLFGSELRRFRLLTGIKEKWKLRQVEDDSISRGRDRWGVTQCLYPDIIVKASVRKPIIYVSQVEKRCLNDVNVQRKLTLL